MAGTSKRTKVMMVRLPVDVAEKVVERADKLGVSVSEYMRRILVIQVTRKHR